MTMDMEKNFSLNIKKVLLALFAAFLFSLLFFGVQTHADQVDIQITSSDGTDTAFLLDDDYMTHNITYYESGYASGTELTITSEEEMTGIYIKWDDKPGEWTLTVGETELTYGQNDFLHEYVELPEPATEVKITILSDNIDITDIYGFSAGELPDWVQTWDTPYEQADILLISCHADDEILFYGGIIPNYTNGGNYRVQVAYFCDFHKTETYRQHEQLDGLWAMGVTHYPQMGEFEDLYSEDLATAESQYDEEECLAYMVEIIRKYKPQVVIGHDENGEYGHGGHMLCSKLTKEAVEISMDMSQYPESARDYGVWDVPKTYLHLYSENQIELDARVPLEDFDGQTALEVATAAYTLHQSQQWMWFYVDDGYDENGEPNGYEYSCTKYGLYRTTVGSDTGNDIMENLTSYDVQEEESRAAETTTTSETETSSSIIDNGRTDTERGALSVILMILGIIAGILVVIVIIMAIIRARLKKKRARERAARREAARRRAMQQQRANSQYGGQGRRRR